MGIPWNDALSSASCAISVRTTLNVTPAAVSASMAGVVGSSVMREAYPSPGDTMPP